MAIRTAFVLTVLGMAAACSAEPVNNAAADNPDNAVTASATTSATPQPIRLKAADGATVFGDYYPAPTPKALILLFHQAGSSKDEYRTIAPRLVKAGYSALAIDQRAGGSMFGKNETAAAIGHDSDFLSARQDMQAALDWAQAKGLPIVLWGSSYSSSLIFPLAAHDPAGIKALLAFSPGEYFDDKTMIERTAAKVRLPVFITYAKDDKAAESIATAPKIFAVLGDRKGSTLYVPEHGVHGSSTLIAAKDPKGAAANWRAVLDFLRRAVG